MKRMAIAFATSLLIVITIIMFATSGFVALLSDEDSFSGIDEDNFDYYEVTGMVTEGSKVKLKLRNKKTGATINNIEFEANNKAGTITTYINVPSSSKRGLTSSGATGTKLVGEREKMAWQFLLRNGFSKAGAAGLLANLNSETNHLWVSNVEEGDEPGYHTDYRGETVLLRGYGIAQWTNTDGDTKGRRYKVIQYLKKKGIDPAKDSDEAFLAQLEYLITEPGYEDIVAEMMAATDPGEAARLWCEDWERPRNAKTQASRRASVGEDYYSTYKDIEAYDPEPEEEELEEEETETLPLTAKYEWKKVGTHGTPYQFLTLEGKLAQQAFGLCVLVILPFGVRDYVAHYFMKSNQEAYEEYIANEIGASAVRGMAIISNMKSDIEDVLKLYHQQREVEEWCKLYLNFTPSVVMPGTPWLTSRQGCRCWSGHDHLGIDLQGPHQGVIYSVYPGTVTTRGYVGGWGNCVVVTSINPVTGDVVDYQYSHLHAFAVQLGESVSAGEVIGLQGNTGNSKGSHLDLTIYINDALVNPEEQPFWGIQPRIEATDLLEQDKLCTWPEYPKIRSCK